MFVDDNKINMVLISVNSIMVDDNLSWMNIFNISLFILGSFIIVIISVRDKGIIKRLNLFKNDDKGIMSIYNFNIC